MGYIHARLGKKKGKGVGAQVDILKMDGTFIGYLEYDPTGWTVGHCCIVPEFRDEFTSEALQQAKEQHPEG